MGQVFHQANFDCFIQTDASGSWGCGAFFFPHWFQYTVLGLLNGLQLILWLKNSYPSSLAVSSGLHYSHTRKFFQCDNQSLVSAINKGSSKDSMVMHLLRCLWFIKASFDIHITATHFQAYTIMLPTCSPGIRVKNSWLHTP